MPGHKRNEKFNIPSSDIDITEIDGFDNLHCPEDIIDEMQKDMIYMMFIRGNCVISVEPAYSNNGVVMGHDAKVALFYMDDCKQDVIDYCVNRDMEVTLFDFEGCDCDCSECACKKDEKTTATTTSKSTYKINNNEVSKEEFDKKYEEFEEMYLDNIRDMFLKYCGFMDEMNEWRRLLVW